MKEMAGILYNFVIIYIDVHAGMKTLVSFQDIYALLA